MTAQTDAAAAPSPANENRWAIDMATRVAIVRHRRPLEVHPVEIAMRLSELKLILSEVLHTEAMQAPRWRNPATQLDELTPGSEAKRRMAIVMRKEAQAELAAMKEAHPRVGVV